MSNAEVARRSYEAFNRDDLEGALAMMDAEIEWHQAQGLPHGGDYQGIDAVRKAIFGPLDEEWWDDFRAEPTEFLDGHDHVVVLGRYSGRAKATGRALDIPFAHVWRFRDRKAVEFHQFTDTRGWTEALGLERIVP